MLFIYRKAADRNYRLEDLSPEEHNTAEIHIAKHRNGPTGVVKLFFDATRASFRNMARHDQGAPQLAAAGGAPALGAGEEPPSFDPNTPIATSNPI
jgi:hypothetical protein